MLGKRGIQQGEPPRSEIQTSKAPHSRGKKTGALVGQNPSLFRGLLEIETGHRSQERIHREGTGEAATRPGGDDGDGHVANGLHGREDEERGGEQRILVLDGIAGIFGSELKQRLRHSVYDASWPRERVAPNVLREAFDPSVGPERRRRAVAADQFGLHAAAVALVREERIAAAGDASDDISKFHPKAAGHSRRSKGQAMTAERCVISKIVVPRPSPGGLEGQTGAGSGDEAGGRHGPDPRENPVLPAGHHGALGLVASDGRVDHGRPGRRRGRPGRQVGPAQRRAGNLIAWIAALSTTSATFARPRYQVTVA
mmetsp:Transcript_6604/g.15837  ORF Transcript_6604/g.15837 Transcript_6604/m.15837 type:complete len:313 (-) Transcript_6604:283-1221(-)